MQLPLQLTHWRHAVNCQVLVSYTTHKALLLACKKVPVLSEYNTQPKQSVYLELVWQILGEPGVGLDACNGDPVGRVAHKDLAHHVQALPGDVQVCGEAVLHPHDPLQPCTVHVTFLA